MRLLILSSHLFPNYKNPNAGSFVVEQVRHLSRHCDITVIVPHPWVPPFAEKLSAKWRQYKNLPAEETIAGVRVLHPRRIVLPKVNSWVWMTISVTLCYWHFFRTLQLSFRVSDFDIIEGQFALPDGFAAAWLGRKFGKPSIVHIHGTDVHTIPNESRLQRWLVQWTLRHADAVRAVSMDLAKRARELIETGKRRNVDAERKFWVVPNGVDLNKFRLMSRQEARRHLGLKEGQRYLLYVGRLVPVKGLDLLLNAAALAMKQRTDVNLLLVGDGYERENLKRLAEELGIAQRVHFVGSQTHDRIPLWMNAGDVFCLLSHKEGFPSVLLETLSCGTPVVATAVGGIPEIVADGQLGRLVYSRDPEEAAAKILEVLDADWDRENLRQHAMQFSWSEVTKQLIALYHNLTREGSKWSE